MLSFMIVIPCMFLSLLMSVLVTISRPINQDHVSWNFFMAALNEMAFS